MSQRVGIALIAAFVSCFVGSCAFGTLSVVNFVTRPDRRPPPRTEVPLDEVVPVPEPIAEPEPVAPTGEPSEAEAPAYARPTLAQGQFAVYRFEKPKADPFPALQRAAKGARLAVYQGEAPDDAVPPYLVLREFALADYAPLEGSFLEAGRGLTAEQKAKLPKTTQPVSVIDAVMPLETDRFLDVARTLAAFAASTGGILWDEETREYFTVEAWRATRIGTWEKGVPRAMDHFTVPVTSGETTAALRTAGLRHFGFAEVELRGVPLDEIERAIGLLNATAQTFIEAEFDSEPFPLTIDLAAIRHVGQWKNLEGMTTKGAAKKVLVHLVPGDSEKWPTLELRFGEGVSVEEGLAELFGPRAPGKPE